MSGKNNRNYFQRGALLLFFIVSLVPALVVSALWYRFASEITPNHSLLSFGDFFVPIALTGLGPAIILSIIFANLLAQPIKRINQSIHEISRGNFDFRLKFRRHTEFRDMAEALNEIATTMQDMISQQAQENEVVTAERNKLTAVLNAMTDGVIALDHQNRIIQFNQAAATITGQPLGQLANQPLEQAVSLVKDNRTVVSDWLAGPHGRPPQLERWHDVAITKHDGSVTYMDAQIVTIDQPNGLNAVLTLHDLTRDHELENMKVDFVALAAHELRTPLSSIRGYLDVLQAEIGKKLEPTQRSFLNRSIIGANQLATLVNNLLNVSRIERGELNYVFESTDWVKFLSSILDDFDNLAREQKRKLVVKLPRNRPHVLIDQLALTEVINNLIDNALNHTREGGTITVRVTATPKEVQTVVSDDGEGIPKAAIGKLFTKFYRYQGLKGGRGTGLGLFICKSIVEAHHGYVWVESEPGRGANFGFSLPPNQAVAHKINKADNEINAILKGAHGWIKQNPHS